MNVRADPFLHHPELRDLITDPERSQLRNFTIAPVVARMTEIGVATGWWYSDARREALRTAALEKHRGGDLWVFGYGSLMWDPGFHFLEVRRAHVSSHARRFILRDIYGGRGTQEAPGLMAALDAGPGCDGLVFRIAEDAIDRETGVLWCREQIGPAYHAEFVAASADGEPVEALTFVADHAAELIVDGLTRAEQIRYIATGYGFLGTSLDYLRNVHRKLSVLGIHDEDVSSLLRDTEAFAARL